jgi:hypothetical protein
VLESGRTKPLLLECEVADNADDELGTFVVKAPGLKEVSDYELFVETLGYLLANELGVETPQPAVVTLDVDFVGVLNPILKSFGLSVHEGDGFGSELITGGVMVTGHEHQNPEQAARARDIFCYDLIVQNPDRLQRNPNCLLKAGRFVAFDFNMAFTFLTHMGESYEPWQFSKHQISDKHLFLPSLRGKEIAFKPFIDRVKALAETRLIEILDTVPFSDGRWNEKVRDHVMSIVKNADKLEIEFARCLL